MGNSDSAPHSSHSHSASHTSYSSDTGFRAFADGYSDVGTLQSDLRRAGLESSNLIVGVDWTKSNEWTGKVSFQGRCLHAAVGAGQLNPYEQAISIVGSTLAPFDEDQLIPTYGFGDVTTHDSTIFSFLPGDAPCRGFDEVLHRYRQLASCVTLSGPTSFGPLIRKAVHTVAASGNQFHVLLIIADGQVTRGSDLPAHEASPQERDTIDAIVAASRVPLSIVMVGVGDGPWDTMRAFDDLLPERAFDNFQFVPLTETLSRAAAQARSRGIVEPEAVRKFMDATFALHALMEVPEQYRAIQRLRLLGPAAAASAAVRPVSCLNPPLPAAAAPPPPSGPAPSSGGPYPGMPGAWPPGASLPYGVPPGAQMPPGAAFPPGAWPPAGAPYAYGPPPGAYGHPAPAGYPAYGMPPAQAPSFSAPAAPAGFAPVVKPQPVAAPAPAAAPAAAPARTGGDEDAARLRRELENMRESQSCNVCLERPKDTAFQCGHQVCHGCAPSLSKCPICRATVTSRIRLFA